MVRLLLATLVLATAAPAGAQAPVAAAAEAPSPLTREQTAFALDALDRALDAYVFPEKAQAARAVLRKNRTRYLAIADKKAFAETMKAEVGAALDDKHFYVNTAFAPPAARGGAPDMAAMAAAEAKIGFGLASVRRLPGNVGYIDLRQFAGSEAAAPHLEAAMDLVQGTEALIIDLRANRGGSGTAMDVLIGRLASTPIPRSTLIWRRPDGGFERVTPETRSYPAEKRYDRPVFLLTANFTISAAEAFAYQLQVAGRATVVGETSRGGANPMNRPLFDLGAGMGAYVATGRSEHPVTKGSPNGVGVVPDVKTPPEEALAAAYRLALEHVRAPAGADPFARELTRVKADPDAELRRAFAASPS